MADDRVILFDSASTNNDSPVFKIDQQRTIIAVGMQPGDYITFEVVRIEPGKGAQVCGCRLIEGTNALINGVQELLCPACESEQQFPVRLTWRNPMVVLDSPQDSYLRAIYRNDEGDSGVDLGTVTVWAIETDTPDLTDAMRGCPPICCEDEEEEWFPDGIHRCTEENVEVLEVSNCGNKRWTVCGPVVWTDTGQIRCVGDVVEVEQTNQCGQRRWFENGPVEWVPTGRERCLTDIVQFEEENQCGQRRWTDNGPVEWLETGLRRCSGEFVEVQEANQCGDLRWTVTDEAVEWTAQCEPCCSTENDTDTTVEERNQCGETRVVAGPPQVWVATGITQCVENTLRIQEANQCGRVRWQETEEVCGAIAVESDSCLTGDGSVGDPLGIDPDCLRTNVVNVDDITIVGEGSESDPLQVQLSADEGNQIEIRDDGLYYGTEAPPEIANLYVSPSLGDDGNAGTRDAPLATIREAISRHMNNAALYTVHLRSGETHVINTNLPSRRLSNLELVTYDEPVYQDQPDQGPCLSYTPVLGAEFQRATIVFQPRAVNDDWLEPRFNNARISLVGLNITQTNPSGVNVRGNGFNFSAEDAITCGGVNFDTGPTSNEMGSMLSAPVIRFQRCSVAGENGLIYTSVRTPTVISSLNANQTNGCGIYEPYTPNPDNIQTIALNDLIDEPVHDATTKSQFNYRTSWDPWA